MMSNLYNISDLFIIIFFICINIFKNIMKASRIVKPKVPLEIQEIETLKPRDAQVILKVQSAGVCHSDIHLWEGGYIGPGGQLPKFKSFLI
jgi:NADPH:quinone reductase-like Zn-dependent oxidoreductase